METPLWYSRCSAVLSTLNEALRCLEGEAEEEEVVEMVARIGVVRRKIEEDPGWRK